MSYAYVGRDDQEELHRLSLGILNDPSKAADELQRKLNLSQAPDLLYDKGTYPLSAHEYD